MQSWRIQSWRYVAILLLALTLLAGVLPGPSEAAEPLQLVPATTTTVKVNQSCSGGQVCSPPRVLPLTPISTVDIAPQKLHIKVSYDPAPGHCSDVSLRLFYNNVLIDTTPSISPGESFERTYTVDTTGPLTVQAVGHEGGCNVGTLVSWGGTFEVSTLCYRVTNREFRQELRKMAGQLALHLQEGGRYIDIGGKFDSVYRLDPLYQFSLMCFRNRVMLGTQLNYYFQGWLVREYGGILREALYIARQYRRLCYGDELGDNRAWAVREGYNDRSYAIGFWNRTDVEPSLFVVLAFFDARRIPGSPDWFDGCTKPNPV